MFLSRLQYLLLPSLGLLFLTTPASGQSLQNVISDPSLSINGVNFSTRAHWMRRANAALGELVSPCPFGAFGTVIVNHTAAAAGGGLGELVCIGANNISLTGNPSMHGINLPGFLFFFFGLDC